MKLHWHRWDYFVSNPPLMSYAYQYDGRIDMERCEVCGKLRRIGSEKYGLAWPRRYVDDQLQPVNYMRWRWSKADLEAYRKALAA